MKTYKHNNIKYWYDPNIKLWTIITMDKHGNQINDAEYFQNKTDMLNDYPDFKFKAIQQ